MQVQDFMNKDVSYCSPGTNASTVAEIMWRKNCGVLPIVDNGHVVGTVTDRDLFIALGTSNRRPSELVVGEIMRRDPAVCDQASDIRTALRIMGQRQLRRLPVVDERGTLKGILSISDVALRAPDELSTDLLTVIRAVLDRRDRRKAAQRAAWFEQQAA
jgi:CBS domain-containing protein